jgi:hypothetical protein
VYPPEHKQEINLQRSAASFSANRGRDGMALRSRGKPSTSIVNQPSAKCLFPCLKCPITPHCSASYLVSSQLSAHPPSCPWLAHSPDCRVGHGSSLQVLWLVMQWCRFRKINSGISSRTRRLRSAKSTINAGVATDLGLEESCKLFRWPLTTTGKARRMTRLELPDFDPGYK